MRCPTDSIGLPSLMSRGNPIHVSVRVDLVMSTPFFSIIRESSTVRVTFMMAREVASTACFQMVSAEPSFFFSPHLAVGHPLPTGRSPGVATPLDTSWRLPS